MKTPKEALRSEATSFGVFLILMLDGPQRPILALGLELHHVGEDAARLQQLRGRTLLR